MTSKRTGGSARVLLAGVFGPFGVDDDFGRKENIMELFHNQVTREQALASFRFQHRSFGLYFLAENIDADVTVLDFPSKKRFEKEVSKGYDIVGISFIAPNFVKAREMARIVRKQSPNATLILGGHGAAIEGVDELIDCDHVVQGEGIRWLRTFLGQNPDAPIAHPALPSTENTRIFGVPVPGTAANLLVPGVGCVNACKFCCTSHFFGKAYTSYLSTGKELFATASAIADRRGTNEFFVMDENFLKDRERAMELVEEMERHERFFEFQIFSSAEAITAFGPDNLERLGVTFIWIGVESSTEEGNFAKNQGINPRALVKDLRDRGIIVLASGILCAEHHTPENIVKDINFMVELESDFVQFMLLTPLPVTALYMDQKRRGLLREDLPFEEWHGQQELSFRHPAFPGDSAAQWLRHAFQEDYRRNSSSMTRVLDTTMRGYDRLHSLGDLPPILEARRLKMTKRLKEWSSIVSVIQKHPVNKLESERGKFLDEELRKRLPLTPIRRAERLVARSLAAAWLLRIRLLGDRIQPSTIVTRYLRGQRDGILPTPTEIPASIVAADTLRQVG
jgi:hypothetical protein